MPDEYVAMAKLSDERKTTDLLIGQNSMSVFLRDINPNNGNEGTDDIAIYALILTSEDFIDKLANCHLAACDDRYYAYLRECYKRPFWENVYHVISPTESKSEKSEEIKELIRESVRYNYNSKYQTLDIQVADQSPQVAAELLDSAISILKAQIAFHRTLRSRAAKHNAQTKYEQAYKEYKEASNRYATFAESHQEAVSKSAQSALESLRKDYSNKLDFYREAAEGFVREDFLTKKHDLSFVVVRQDPMPQKPLTPRHWVYVLVASLIAAVGCFWHYLYKKKQGLATVIKSLDFGNWFAPWNLSVAIWAAILGLYYIQDTSLNPITEQFYMGLVLWLPILCATSFITYNLTNTGRQASVGSIEFNRTLFTVFYVISMIITPLYVYRVAKIVTMFSTEDLMNNVRLLALYGEGQGFLNYSSVINQSLFVVALWARPKVPMWQLLTLAGACLLNALAIMEKGTMFFVFFCFIFVLFERKVIKIRSILVSGALLLFVFYLFNLARAEQDSDYQTNETFLDFFAMYALSPPVAFCQLMADVTPQFGTNTFETIYLFLDRFGVNDIVVKDKLQEFVWVPIPTNVYTILQPFYVDFGYKGVAFFAGVYGVVTGMLYRLYRNGSNYGCCLYTYAAEVLVLQFYQENVFLSLVFVLQFTVFTVLFTQKKVALSFHPKAH